jgi:hypothetical protein
MPGCPPTLAPATPATSGNRPGLDRGASAGRRLRTVAARPQTGHSMVRTRKRREARQHWPGRCSPPQGLATRWTRRPKQTDDIGSKQTGPGPDILWSAPRSAEKHASIGLGDADHLREWPRDGPGSPSTRATEDPSGRASDRTFYGPHLEAPRDAPALAWAMLTTQGMATGWTTRPRQADDKGPQ